MTIKKTARQVLLGAPLAFSSVCAADKPNVVIVLMDDVGSAWLPPYARRLKPEDIDPAVLKIYSEKQSGQSPDPVRHLEAARTSMPFLERLAKDGAVFDRCVATASLCSPSRAGLLTGCYQQRWGAYWNDDVEEHGIPADRTLIAEPLRAAGYRCGMIGKWHVARKDPAEMERIWVSLGNALPVPQKSGGEKQFREELRLKGYLSSSIPGEHPLDRGFDYYFGYNNSGDKDYRSESLWENRSHVPKRPPEEFLTDLLNEKACTFIDRTLKEKKPFFLYYAPKTAHGPLSAPPEKYSSAFDAGIGFSNEYAGHLRALDCGLEMIFKTLEKYGQVSNTLFILSSDNGCASASYCVPPYNAPYQGGKGTGWLGGMMVPLVIHQPGTVKPFISGDIVSLADIMPTVLEAAGIPSVANTDGRSLLPLLSGQTKEGPRREVFSSGIHSARWSVGDSGEVNQKDAQDCPLYVWRMDRETLVMHITSVKPGLYSAWPKGGPARSLMFDLSTDIQQHRDVRAANPEKAQAFDAAINSWLKALQPPLTAHGDDYEDLIRCTQ